jgi:hypothetical protein
MAAAGAAHAGPWAAAGGNPPKRRGRVGLGQQAARGRGHRWGVRRPCGGVCAWAGRQARLAPSSGTGAGRGRAWRPQTGPRSGWTLRCLPSASPMSASTRHAVPMRRPCRPRQLPKGASCGAKQPAALAPAAPRARSARAGWSARSWGSAITRPSGSAGQVGCAALCRCVLRAHWLESAAPSSSN